MKKRRLCVWNHPHSPKKSPRTVHLRISESFSVKTKSSIDLKRRRLHRPGSSKSQRGNKGRDEDTFIKTDRFSSLDSLFNVKKPLNLPELSPKYQYISSSFYLKDNVGPKKLVEKLFLEQQSKFEPNILQQLSRNHLLENGNTRENGVNEESQNNDDLSLEKNELETGKYFEINEKLSETQDSIINMAENEDATIDETGDEEITEPEVPQVDGEDNETTRNPTDAENINTNNDVAQIEPPPPPHPIPPGVGEGVPIKPGGRRESLLSSTPLIDGDLLNEMREADERCAVIKKEIEQLKQEIIELTNKTDLTEEDAAALEEKQDDIMSKLAESEEITRKLQRLLGLSDPSSFTFAKMFEMLPYPSVRPDVTIIEEPADEQGDERRELVDKRMLDDEIQQEDEKVKMFIKGDHFDLPQIEYPEDKLPRVIVCGRTEENIPKIVVADSERKGKKKCIENLTGKLTESLTMQEKLVQENAQLEGGKYKLEEALLQKDSAVESLQRKVCGLQAEMRIVVKENTELTRQLANLNQRVTSPPCCCTCPGSTSSTSAPTSPRQLHPHAYSNSLSVQQDEDYCPCKSCYQPQPSSTLRSNVNTISTNRGGYKSSCCSPRLCGGGGGSRTEECYLLSGSSSQTRSMCCRSPAAAKTVCTSPQQKGVCPAELGNNLANYGNSTKQLEHQLGSIESEIRNMQMELANVQRERQQLEQQRKLLKCTGPCAPCACNPPSSPCTVQTPSAAGYGASSTGFTPILPPTTTFPKAVPHTGSTTCTGPCITAPMGASTCPQQQLRDLREQYARLQDDYKNKLCEVSCLRADSEKLKQEAREAKEEKEKMEIKMIDAQERMKLLEAEKVKYEGYKEQLVEQEQALQVSKQRFREAQDELEELRSLIQDQASQLEDYRNKYLQAQQQVEEQRRQLDLMEMDNARMNENVTLEIGRVKNQFQEKLAELAPLPDILKQTQIKLQEAQQLRLVAERNCEDLSRDLIGCKDKIQTLQNQLDSLRTEYQILQDEKGHGTGRYEELERKNNELRHENERMKNTLARFEEHEAQLQKRIDEKMHEITQLNATLDQIREDSARQVARTKERCETVRRSMQNQIADMERQVAQCRATARAAQKDRDEIRQKMQGQINNLNEAFEQAQGRIKSLQGHVNYLKTSYSNIFKGQGEVVPGTVPGDVPGTGYDTCDCSY